MPVITFTTDFGHKDPYLGMIKGHILARCPDAQLVDIGNDIPAFDIIQAAFVLGTAYPVFPANTIHLITVNNRSEPDLPFLVRQHASQFFIGPDNGVFSLLFKQEKGVDRRVQPDRENHFPLMTLLGDCVAAIAREKKIDALGELATDSIEKIPFHPVTEPAQIRGSVIYVDRFGNAVVNITKSLFLEIGMGRPFELFFKRESPITRLSAHYCSVEVGEPLCFFNSSGFLEIAVNMGRAATLLGLQKDDTVQIEFFSES